MAWVRGETIIVQEIWHGRLWSARPVVVVEDSPAGLVHWCPRGTAWRVATTPPERARAETRAERFAASMELDDWVLGDFEWQVPSLEFVVPGEWFAVRVSWTPSGEHWGWYINLQEPFRRVSNGIQTMDLMLDVVVDADRSWRWKDEDELALLVDRGLVASATAERVRASGIAAVEHLERRDPPFDDAWPRWKPDPSWPVPVLSEQRQYNGRR